MYVVGKKDGTEGFPLSQKIEREREPTQFLSFSSFYFDGSFEAKSTHRQGNRQFIACCIMLLRKKSHVLLILMSHVSKKANSFSYPLATEHLCRRRTQEGNGIRQCGSLEACYREGKGGESQPGGWEMAMRDWHLCTCLSSAN